MIDKIKSFERIAIPKRLRFEVFKHDGFECCYCGATPPGILLECDHIEPVSAGGLTEIDNLVTSCQACNRGKYNIPLTSVPQRLSERASEILEREAQIAGYQAIMKSRRMRLESNAQEVLNLFCECFHMEGISQAQFTSIKRFVEKLGMDECLWAVERAQQVCPYSSYRAFKYFCGVCWKKIRDHEEA